MGLNILQQRKILLNIYEYLQIYENIYEYLYSTFTAEMAMVLVSRFFILQFYASS